jgi:hypothetical protein
MYTITVSVKDDHFISLFPIFFTQFFNYYCCVGQGFIVAFTKVLTMYKIYHT